MDATETIYNDARSNPWRPCRFLCVPSVSCFELKDLGSTLKLDPLAPRAFEKMRFERLAGTTPELFLLRLLVEHVG